MKIIISFLFAFVLITSLASCDDDDTCSSSTDSVVYSEFYTIINGNEQDTMLDNVSIYGIGNEGYFIYYERYGLGNMFLPLSAHTDSCSFVIDVNFAPDTLTMYYSSELNFLSQECGFVNIYDISNIKTTHNNIDSISITNKKVTTEYGQNIKIYF